MYIKDHIFHIPSAPVDPKKINPLVLMSPNASIYRRQNSASSISSTASTTSGSRFLSYSPPPSPTLYVASPTEDADDAKVSKGIDLHARALLLLSLLYTNTFSTDATAPVINDLIHPSCTFEVEHFDASTSTINSRDEYLKGWSQKVQCLGEITSTVKECVVDESQWKVWVVNELTIGGNLRKESVDMLTFDGRGKMTRREGWLRRKSSKRDTD